MMADNQARRAGEGAPSRWHPLRSGQRVSGRPFGAQGATGQTDQLYIVNEFRSKSVGCVNRILPLRLHGRWRGKVTFLFC